MVTAISVRRARTAAAAAATAAMLLVVSTGCGSGTGDTGEAEGGSPGGSRPAGSTSSERGARAAELIGEALDATFAHRYLQSERRTKTEGTTVLRSAVHEGRAECEARSRKGDASLEFVVTASALYSRGSKEALELSPEARTDPARVAVMADRWVQRNAAAAEAMREMCTATAQRTWLEERIPSLDALAGQTPVQEPAELEGQSTTRITYRRQDGPLRFHIAAQGTPLLLRVTYPATDLDESFGAFGKPFRVAAPTGAVSELRIAQEVLAAR
ncbi:hypothetical protein [Streptomyces sp. NPDC015242]|uniref:hypothetical protein n=1 Tax=Streptomyces sp. NPDC015242 TaxID=3364951 RepID=UPI003701516F